jgi:predicted nucleic acid-binding protein
MRVAYVDSSVVVRYYLIGDHGHSQAVAPFDDVDTALVTATLTQIEVSGALVRATRSIGQPAGAALDRFDADLADGLVTLVGADQSEVDAGALAIVRSHGLRALDALHLSTARLVLPELAGPGDSMVFLTADDRQAAAATAIGLEVG